MLTCDTWQHMTGWSTLTCTDVVLTSARLQPLEVRRLSGDSRFSGDSPASFPTTSFWPLQTSVCRETGYLKVLGPPGHFYGVGFSRKGLQGEYSKVTELIPAREKLTLSFLINLRAQEAREPCSEYQNGSESLRKREKLSIETNTQILLVSNQIEWPYLY